MRAWILSLIALAVLSAVGYSSYDYGVKTTELAWQTSQDDLQQVATDDRAAQAAVETPQVAAAIDNVAARELENQLLKEQVATYEAELQKSRTVACNLSADTIARMQQYGKTRTYNKQLAAGARVSAIFTACGDADTDNGKPGRDGDTVFQQRFTVLGSSMQPYRPGPGSAIAAASNTG